MNKGRGSALIMVMLVVAGITTIIFSTQRIALVQFSQSVREEDNLAATYAAQAGIEDGLARYRFEKNTETTPDYKFRFNLTKGTFPVNPTEPTSEIAVETNIEDGIDGDYDPNFQYYDLVVNYKTQFINVNGGNGGDGSFDFSTANDILKKDSAINLTGFPDNNDDYYLRYGFRFSESCADKALAFVALQQTAIDVTGKTIISQDLAKYENAIPDGSNNFRVIDSRATTNIFIKNTTSRVTSIAVRAFYCDVEFAFITSKSSIGDGNGIDAGPEFDSLTTEVLSTGYFGSAKRTLIAQVDRTSGELIGIFDFLLYAGDVNSGTIR